MADSADDAAGFAENLLALLDEGRTTATYKFAVLLALIDVCLEGFKASGAAPSSVTTRQLAERVVEIYFPQTSFFPGSAHVLRQNSGGQAEIVDAITRFRGKHAPDPSAPLARARAGAPRKEWEKLVRFVEWKLVEMPLPKLQRLGRTENRFLYELPWGTRTSEPRQADVMSGDFDNRILLHAGAAEHLVRFAPLVRPLAQRKWASLVANFNALALRGENIEEFLFGADRLPLDPVRDLLGDLQEGRCFYCARRLPAAAVDHFVPWSRHPDNGIENLVATDTRCNADKSDFLAAAEHVARWTARNERHAADLARIATATHWDRHPERTIGAARAIYLRLTERARLWLQARDFTPADPAVLKRALGETSD